MREAPYLRKRTGAILSTVGLIVAIEGILFLAPLLAIVAWPDDGRSAAAFLIPGLILAIGGLAIRRRLDPGEVVLTLQEGGVIVLLSWIAAFLAGAVPFMVIEGLDFTQAMFESVSGWTTTGLSVIDVTAARPTTLLWRSVMQLAGGAGLAIVMLAALTGAGGQSLSAAEGRSEQLAPNVRASALLVMRIYAGYVAFGILALRLAGMDWFDAVNHAFCALSTGGFSTRPESIGFWDSPGVEAVTLVLMLLGGLNFVTAWCLLRGRFGAVARNGEVRLAAVLIPAGAALLFWLTCAPLYGSLSKAARVAIFETTSALTTTGYSTVGYGDWNPFGVTLLLALMAIGGATCSTAGGMKQFRVYLLWRSLARELRRPFLPRAAVVDDSIWEGEDRVQIGDARVRTVATFIFLYLATLAAGAAVMAAHGYGVKESIFEYASTLGTVGLSVGVTGPATPPAVLWTQVVGMFLGRLEFFVVLTSAAKVVGDAVRMARPARA